jgi:hypothetical protein
MNRKARKKKNGILGKIKLSITLLIYLRTYRIFLFSKYKTFQKNLVPLCVVIIIRNI